MSTKASTITADIERSIATKQKLLSQVPQIEAIAQALVTVLKQGGTIYSCGNGGSACDSMHLTEELVSRYLRTRPGIKAHHFIDGSAITCWGNDESFDDIFARQVETYVQKNDALVVFSTSGKSPNIVRALEAAAKIGATTIALLGKDGGLAQGMAQLPIVIGSNESARIQECHILIVHILCELIETELFPDAK